MGYSLRMIKLLQQYDITPIFVFDGAALPAKAETNATRNRYPCRLPRVQAHIER